MCVMPRTAEMAVFGLPLRQAGAAGRRPEPAVRVCANCTQPLTGRGAVRRGPDTAWHGHCLGCHELVREQTELAEDRPGGMPIQVHRCLRCGDLRSCRPGWHTRCHVCLDERTDQRERASQECLAMFARDPLLALRVGRNIDLGRGQQITARVIVKATSCLTVASQLARFERPGWTVIATDVWGLPSRAGCGAARYPRDLGTS